MPRGNFGRAKLSPWRRPYGAKKASKTQRHQLIVAMPPMIAATAKPIWRAREAADRRLCMRG